MADYFASGVVLDSAQKAYIGKSWSFKIMPADSMPTRVDVIEIQYTYDQKWQVAEVTNYKYADVLGGRTVTITVPIEIANLTPNSDHISMQIECKSYVDEEYIGSSFTTATFYVPDSMVPSCSLNISDATSHRSKYGGYVYSKSKLYVQASPRGVYGSTIKSCIIEANGQTHTQSLNSAAPACNFTTDELRAYGTLSVKATVVDSRGRSCTTETQVTVLNYTAPVVRSLTATRCDADGTANRKGLYVKVTFSAEVTTLNNRNTARYSLGFKKRTESSFTTIDVTEYANNYLIADATRIFAADGNTTYNVQLSVTDDLHVTLRSTTAPTAYTRMHFPNDYNSIGLGKVAEQDDILDIGYQTRFFGGIKPMELYAGTDFNYITNPNFYVGAITPSSQFLNGPDIREQFALEVLQVGPNAVLQRITAFSGDDCVEYRRFYNGDTWKAWKQV